MSNFGNNDVMLFDRLTENAKTVIQEGYNIAKEYGYSEYGVIHLFLALIRSKNGAVQEILSRLGVETNATEERIKAELKFHSETSISESKTNKLSPAPKFSEQIKKIIDESYSIAAELNQVYVGTEHLFMGMFKLDGIKFIEDMKMFGVDLEQIKRIVSTLGSDQLLQMNKNSRENRPQQGVPDFCRDMTMLAEEGRYPNVTGRDSEIKRLVHILSRKTKNNPILVGDAGVGKTAIMEGFVNKIVDRLVPSSILNKRVLSVDVAAIIAGAKLRGDVEERINYIVTEAIEDGETILFIDEIHNIVGAGSAGGRDSMDLANILKPYLTESDLIVVGATTSEEYSKYFENDSALKRRFQPILVDELDEKSAITVLNNVKKEFEAYHKVKIKPEAIEDAVKLSNKFIKDRFLPDKAIDLIDEAAASIKIGREVAIEPELSKLGLDLIQVQEKKEMALKGKNLERASELKDKEAGIIDEIAAVIEGKKKVQKKYPNSVNSDLIKQILVEWTKIPIAANDISDKTLKGLENRILKKIIGQDIVVKNVSLAIQRSHLGLTDGKRPLGSFLFLGPTGVGKTELAKTLARELFGDEKLMIQVDMSEFMENHSVAKLIGSPPGYVGYDKGGQLTNFVRRRPYCVVLLDEIEKAHPDTLNILLQILEEGHITDGQGKKVDMSNTIVVMTSNIGAEEVSTNNRLGFDVYVDTKEEQEEFGQAYKDMKENIIERLRNTLRPELLNRIDLIDVFKGLNKQECLTISANITNELKMRLIQKGIILDVPNEVINHINEKGYSKEYGGRNIRRTVQEVLENGLAQYLLSSKIPKKRNSLMHLACELKGEEVRFKKA